MADTNNDTDLTHKFLLPADKMLWDAPFIVDSLPNVELFSVERSLRQLHAIYLVLMNLDDHWLQPDEIEGLTQAVLNVLQPLQTFCDAPPPPQIVGTATTPSGSSMGGRPRYDIDLEEALRLHSLGNSWDSVSDVMGVTRATMYRHLSHAGLSTAQQPFTEISDEDLDEHISSIPLEHPFVGSSIMMGHLEAKGIHLPSERIQESLRRVDALGVLVRYIPPPVS